jgi:hypothetical protein
LKFSIPFFISILVSACPTSKSRRVIEPSSVNLVVCKVPNRFYISSGNPVLDYRKRFDDRDIQFD